MALALLVRAVTTVSEHDSAPCERRYIMTHQLRHSGWGTSTLATLLRVRSIVGCVLSAGVIAATALGLLAVPRVATAVEPATVSPKDASQIVAATDVRTHDGVVSGTIVNKSNATLDDVRLLIDHSWLWANEFKPGTDNPSRTDFYVIPKAIPPHGRVPFTYETNPPLPQRNDGHFKTRVEVTGFTQVGGVQESARSR
jgi:hypothetical protein